MENEKKHFFSISMPIYNAERFLDEAIASVINQDYDAYELILVDDNSSDNSIKICEAWKNKYPQKIVLAKNRIKGSLYARRECIHHSKGEYLYIMDSDDYLVDTSALKKWNCIINSTNCDLIIFNEMNHRKKIFDEPSFEKGKIIEQEELVLIYNAILTDRSMNVVWDKVFKIDLVDFSDDEYKKNSFLSYGTDFFQCCEILSNARKIYYLNEQMYYYRKNPNSITHSYNPNMLNSAESIISRRKKISKQWKYKPDNLTEKLEASTLVEYCTVINKLKLANITINEIVAVLSCIGENANFINSYKAKTLLPRMKRLVLTMLHFKLYKIVAMILKLIP